MNEYMTERQKRLILIVIFIGFLVTLIVALTDTGEAALPDPWDRSSIEVTGQCLADGTAQFTVTNTGEPMAAPSTWRLFQADALIEQGAFQLLSGAQEIFEFGPAWNVPIRFEADQRIGHPGASEPRLTLTCQRPTAVTLKSFGAAPARLCRMYAWSCASSRTVFGMRYCQAWQFYCAQR